MFELRRYRVANLTSCSEFMSESETVAKNRIEFQWGSKLQGTSSEALGNCTIFFATNVQWPERIVNQYPEVIFRLDSLSQSFNNLAQNGKQPEVTGALH